MQLDVSIAPLPAAFLRRVRTEGLDDLGQPVKRLTAQGGEPCRDALRRARPGEELILASFSPFSKTGPYKEYGPVFVLADGDPQDRLGDDYLRERFVIRAYSANEEILDAEMVTRDQAPATIARFLASSDTAFLHARFPTYGCFACRIDREPGV